MSYSEALALGDQIQRAKEAYQGLEAQARAAGTLNELGTLAKFTEYVSAADSARQRLASMGYASWAQALSGAGANAEQAAEFMESARMGILPAQYAPVSSGGQISGQTASPYLSLSGAGQSWGGFGGGTSSGVTAGQGVTGGGLVNTGAGFWANMQGAAQDIASTVRQVVQHGGGQLIKWIPFLVAGVVVMKVLDPDLSFKAGPIKADIGK